MLVVDIVKFQKEGHRAVATVECICSSEIDHGIVALLGATCQQPPYAYRLGREIPLPRGISHSGEQLVFRSIKHLGVGVEITVVGHHMPSAVDKV